MLAILKKKPRAQAAPPAVELASPGQMSRPVWEDMIVKLSLQASGLGQEAAEVRGAVDDTDRAAATTIQAIQALAERLQEVETAHSKIDSEAQGSQKAVASARQAVEAVGGEVSQIVDSLREVGQAAGQITQIALQTRLVAFNASVEAKRAGDAGRGFAVVANAVRDLASSVEASSQQITGTMKLLDERVGALAREIQRRDGTDPSDHDGVVHRALASVDQNVGRIQQATLASRLACDALRDQAQDIQTELQGTSRALGLVLNRTDSMLHISEQLLVAVAEAGVDTPDTPFIQAVQAGARQVAKLLKGALDSGAIREADLFDEEYVSIPRSDPAQFTTKFCGMADRLFPSVQEKLLQLSSKVVFCIAVDRNGYVAMHNAKYSQTQRPGDVAWNTANSRFRRIFNDRTGLASARNVQPFLLQTYRRDMGGGNFVVMKEVSAPIEVAGRHWGGLRLAYHF